MRERRRRIPRKRLFSDAKPSSAALCEAWSIEENKALVEFVLFTAMQLHGPFTARPANSGEMQLTSFIREARQLSKEVV